MIVSVIGAGILGLACAASMARGGHQVICADMDEEVVNAVKEGDFPGYEQGLIRVVTDAQNTGRLEFTGNIRKTIKEAEVIFITCEMPEDENNMPSLRFAKAIAQCIGNHMENHKLVVLKSSVPPGSSVVIEDTIQKVLDEREENIPFDVAVCPAFARPGNFLRDIERPKFIAIGADDQKARQKISDLYVQIGFLQSKIIHGSTAEVEMASYAIDGMVAVKTAYVNELTMLCEKLDIDIDMTTRIMGKDTRISPQIMDPGPGFGGSVLPKSVRTLVSLAESVGESASVLKGALSANEHQKQKCFQKIETILDGVADKTIGILGLSMEYGTDDLREAPSLDIIKNLVEKGAVLQIFDPDGYQQAKWRLFKEKDAITFCDSIYDAAEDADAMVI
ncbi:MAG: nucleotide sugar dehydrogenase, partial [Eubacterium sp.]